jgi:hypothetical protein
MNGSRSAFHPTREPASPMTRCFSPSNAQVRSRASRSGRSTLVGARGVSFTLAVAQRRLRHRRPRRDDDGSRSATATVPGPPTGVTARAGDQLTEVTWTAPTPDDPTINGSPVSCGPSTDQPEGFRSRPVADASGAPVLRDPVDF